MYSIKYCNIEDDEFDLELDCAVGKINFNNIGINRIISLNLPQTEDELLLNNNYLEEVPVVDGFTYFKKLKLQKKQN